MWRRRLLELLESCGRHDERPEHPPLLVARIIRVVPDGGRHVEPRRREQTGIVDEPRHEAVDRSESSYGSHGGNIGVKAEYRTVTAGQSARSSQCAPRIRSAGAPRPRPPAGTSYR